MDPHPMSVAPKYLHYTVFALMIVYLAIVASFKDSMDYHSNLIIFNLFGMFGMPVLVYLEFIGFCLSVGLLYYYLHEVVHRNGSMRVMVRLMNGQEHAVLFHSQHQVDQLVHRIKCIYTAFIWLFLFSFGEFGLFSMKEMMAYLFTN